MRSKGGKIHLSFYHLCTKNDGMATFSCLLSQLFLDPMSEITFNVKRC